MSKEISIQAKILRQLIKMATSERWIGPKIKDGTIRKKLVEPQWHCPEGYSLLRVKISHCDIEILTPPKVESSKVIYQLHGGGYIGKIRNVYRSFAKNYSDMRKGMKVFSLDYRVAPKHPYPAAFQDAISGYEFLLGLGYEGRDIILAGDSAGGGLCLALGQYLQKENLEMPAGMVLMSPWTDLTASGTSYDENYTKDPMFGNTRESMIYSGEYYGKKDPKDPYISPLFGDFAGLPPMLYQVGSIEMLLSDSKDAVKKAKEAQCDAILSVYEGMFHVFQMALKRMPESEKAWLEVEEFVNGFEE